MRRVVFSKQAQRDLDGIWLYIAQDGIDAAEKVVDAVERAVRQLADLPGIGHERLELQGRRYRVWSVHSYLIVYRYGPRTVTVVRIVHGARDLRRLPATVNQNHLPHANPGAGTLVRGATPGRGSDASTPPAFPVCRP